MLQCATAAALVEMRAGRDDTVGTSLQHRHERGAAAGLCPASWDTDSDFFTGQAARDVDALSGIACAYTITRSADAADG